jgi:WD40 repeat protein
MVNSLAFSPDGQFLAVGTMKYKTRKRWRYTTPHVLLFQSNNLKEPVAESPDLDSPVNGVSFSPDGETLIAFQSKVCSFYRPFKMQGEKKKVNLDEPETTISLDENVSQSTFSNMVFSPDGQFFIFITNDFFEFYISLFQQQEIAHLAKRQGY